MSNDVRDIIEIQTQTSGPALTQTSFNIPLVLGYHDLYPEQGRARYFSSLAAATKAGHTTETEIGRALAAIFAQKPPVPRVLVGRLTQPSQRTVRISVAPNAALDPGAYRLQLDDLTLEATAQAVGESSTSASIFSSIVKQWATALGNHPSIKLVDLGDGQLTIVSTTTEPSFRRVAVTGPPRSLFIIQDTTDNPSLGQDIQWFSSSKHQWYTLLLASQGSPEIEMAAQAIEPLRRTFFAASSDTDLLMASGRDDLAKRFADKSYTQTLLMWHQDATSHPQAAWAAKTLASKPGTASPMYKTLAGAAVSHLDTPEREALNTKNLNFYVKRSGRGMTSHGYTIDGGFIDTKRNEHFLTTRLEESLIRVFAETPLVPGSADGIGLLDAAIRSTLTAATSEKGKPNILSSEAPFVIESLPAERVPPNERVARNYPGLSVLAYFDTPIHTLKPVLFTILSELPSASA